MGIPPKIVRVYIQGVDTELRPNGSYDLLEVGSTTLDQVLNLLKELPRRYPPEILAMDDWCPINVILETPEARMTIALLEDETYYIMFTDEISGWDYEIPSTDLQGALNAVRRYIGRENIEAPPLSNPSFSIAIESPYGGGELYLVLDPIKRTIDTIPLDDIQFVEISRGSFFSAPKIRIEYVEPATGRKRSVKYKIRNKDAAEKLYRALVEVLGTSRVVLK